MLFLNSCYGTNLTFDRPGIYSQFKINTFQSLLTKDWVLCLDSGNEGRTLEEVAFSECRRCRGWCFSGWRVADRGRSFWGAGDVKKYIYLCIKDRDRNWWISILFLCEKKRIFYYMLEGISYLSSLRQTREMFSILKKWIYRSCSVWAPPINQDKQHVK